MIVGAWYSPVMAFSYIAACPGASSQLRSTRSWLFPPSPAEDFPRAAGCHVLISEHGVSAFPVVVEDLLLIPPHG